MFTALEVLHRLCRVQVGFNWNLRGQRVCFFRAPACARCAVWHECVYFQAEIAPDASGWNAVKMCAATRKYLLAAHHENLMADSLVRAFPVELSADIRAARTADAPVAPEFLERWSPRAFDSRPVEDDKIAGIFEAARWAASSYNEQPWRFLLARTPDDLKKFNDFLLPANQAWAKDAPVLVVVASKKTFSHNGSPNRTYQFCAGAAAAYLALACVHHGLIAHGMAGFDADRARQVLEVPDDFDLLAVFAIGYRGDTNQLPEEIRDREVPSGRRPARDSIMEGRFRDAKEDRAEAETNLDNA